MPVLTTTSPTVAVIDGFAAQFFVDYCRRLQKAAALNGNGLDPRVQDACDSIDQAATAWARRGGHKPPTAEIPAQLGVFCTTKEAAQYLGISPSSVVRRRRRETGPVIQERQRLGYRRRGLAAGCLKSPLTRSRHSICAALYGEAGLEALSTKD